MPRCEGPGYHPGEPVRTCPLNRCDDTVKYGQGDMWLCSECDIARFGGGETSTVMPSRKPEDNNVDTIVEKHIPGDVRNELLCFMQNKMNVMSFDDVVKITTDFYTESEVLEAKAVILKSVPTKRLSKADVFWKFQRLPEIFH